MWCSECDDGCAKVSVWKEFGKGLEKSIAFIDLGFVMRFLRKGPFLLRNLRFHNAKKRFASLFHFSFCFCFSLWVTMSVCRLVGRLVGLSVPHCFFAFLSYLRVEKFRYECFPAQLITAPSQPPATGAVVYTALFKWVPGLLFFLSQNIRAGRKREHDRQKRKNETKKGDKAVLFFSFLHSTQIRYRRRGKKDDGGNDIVYVG